MRFHEFNPLEKQGSRKVVQFNVERIDRDDVDHLLGRNMHRRGRRRPLVERLTETNPVETPLEQLL